jgi:hypothetical protein
VSDQNLEKTKETHELPLFSGRNLLVYNSSFGACYGKIDRHDRITLVGGFNHLETY